MSRGGFLPVIHKSSETSLFAVLGVLGTLAFLGVQARVHSSIEPISIDALAARSNKNQLPIPSPAWGGMGGMDSSVRSTTPSVLSRREHIQELSLLPAEIKLDLVDRNGGLMLQQAYSDMNRSYEMKERFGLVDNYARQERNNQLAALSQSVWSDLRNRQVEQARGMILKSPFATKAVKAAAYIPKPVAILLMAAHAVYFGNVLNWEIGPAKISTLADVQQRKSIVGISHPLLSTSFRVQALNPGTVDPATGHAIGGGTSPTLQYEVALGHTIPDLGLAAGFSYINTSDAFSAKLSQPLVIPNLTATMSAVAPTPRQ